jgi:hypothetical protein
MPAYNPPHPDMPCIKLLLSAMAIACTDRIVTAARAPAHA